MIDKWNEEDQIFYENGFYLTSKMERMSNILSHYELYKKIVSLPGDVVELGVFRGGGLIQFATFRELLENEQSRKVIGFDVFDFFPEAHNEADQKFREKWIKTTNNEYLAKEELEKSLRYKEIGNVELIRGNILSTVPEYLKQNSDVKIALLHIDTDMYEPAKMALEYLYDRVVKGGIIVSDDYAITSETRAIDEFLKNKDLEIHKLSISQRKPSYIIKS